jgi:outer membrane protein
VHRLRSVLVAALGGAALAGLASSASADSIAEALAAAYSSNPEINSARAQTRADDENVPLAKSGRRPIISAFTDVTGRRVDPSPGPDIGTVDGAVGVLIEQNIFRGFRTRNAIRQAEAGVLASRELLRNTVQNVLFDAAQAYMDVLRDIAILDIRGRNVVFLQEQVRAANERFNVGENTRTDVAQAQARLADARADLSLAEANLDISRAVYRQIVGRDPVGLVESFPYARLVPASLNQAIVVGQNGHPVILATIHQTDARAFLVKQIEGELLPTVSVSGELRHDENFYTSRGSGVDSNVAAIAGRVTIPLYQGGAVSARVRQAKELYGQNKIEIDLARDQVRAAVVTAWAQVDAAVGAIEAANQGIEAAEIALTGVQEEQRVGQRTTLDVLDAQQELLNVRETLILARRGLVVASFALLSAMGRLTAEALNLPTPAYDPSEHYTAVRDRWYGTRTPDGR